MVVQIFNTVSIVITGLLFVVMTLLLFRKLALGWASRTWPTTEGEIIVSRVRKTRIPPVKGRALIAYRYTVNDQEYRGSRVYFGYDVRQNPGLAEETASRYRVGTKVTVHYQPNNPKVATLETKVEFFIYAFVALVLALWAVVGLAIYEAIIGIPIFLTARGEPVVSGVFATTPEWTFDTEDVIISTPIVSGDALVIRTEKQVYALDAATREVRWTAESVGSIYDTAPPLITDGVVLVPEDGNPIAAFDLLSGTLLWRDCIVIGGQDCRGGGVYEGLPINDLHSSEGIAAVNRFGGSITAYDVQTGEQVWNVYVPNKGAVSIAIDDGAVYYGYVPLHLGIIRLQAIDLKTGASEWHLDMDVMTGRLVARDGVVYFLTGLAEEAHAVAITGDGESVLWEVPYFGGYGGIGNDLSLDNDTLFVVGNELVAIPIQDGKVLWRIPVEGGLMKPVIFGDMLLVRDKHLLYAFDKRTGAEIGRLSLELAPGRYNVELNPAVFGDLVLIPVGARQIAAYRLQMPGQ